MEYVRLAEGFLKDLIAFRSVNPPGNECGAAAYIADMLAREGFETDLDAFGEGRANVTASYGPHTQREIILCGHLDVVPAGEGWRSDPFSAVEREGAIYGRGACDMKGGIAAMMAAAVSIKREWPNYPGRLVLALVAGEEVDGVGARRFVRRRRKAAESYVLIGEPTLCELAVGHLGVARFRLEFEGRQCHASTPQLGCNALEEAAHFIARLPNLLRRRAELSDPALPPPTVTPTMASAGEKINILPGRCCVYLDCRIGPGDSAAHLERELYALFEEIRSSEEARLHITTLLNAGTGLTPHGSEVICYAQLAYREALGKSLPQRFLRGSTDMPIFQSAGYLDTAILGPGSMDQAHTVDERLEREQLARAVLFYKEFLRIPYIGEACVKKT